MNLSIDEIEKRISDSYELPNQVLEVMPEPMVTVRTSTYQHGPYIKDCIEGVLSQKTNFPVEYIIGEDFSTDGTREIVFDYAKKFPDKIRVITADYNVGAKANGRRCQRVSRGKYMAICEGDDYWTDPLKLQKQVTFLNNHKEYSASCHQSIVEFENTGFQKRYFNDFNNTDICTDDLMGGRIFHTASFIYRTSIIGNNKFPNDILSGDRYLFLLCSLFGKIRFFKKPMCVYRKHDKGISTWITYDLLKQDLNIPVHLSEIDNKFPKYRYLSFIHKTLITYPKKVPFDKFIYHYCMYVILSFSYFPKNMKGIIKFSLKQILVKALK